MREVTKYGKTIDEALSSALDELNATSDEVDIEIIEEPRRGILGFGAKKALVRVILKKTPLDLGIDYLKNVVQQMGISAHIQVKEKDDKTCRCEFVGRDVALLIGKRGQTLNALQSLANLVVNKSSDHKATILLDAEDYRSRRKESLEALAERIAKKVVHSNKSYVLEPMPAFERKVIHLKLQKNPDVETYSSGEEPNRSVTIIPHK